MSPLLEVVVSPFYRGGTQGSGVQLARLQTRHDVLWTADIGHHMCHLFGTPEVPTGQVFGGGWRLATSGGHRVFCFIFALSHEHRLVWVSLAKQLHKALASPPGRSFMFCPLVQVDTPAERQSSVLEPAENPHAQGNVDGWVTGVQIAGRRGGGGGRSRGPEGRERSPDRSHSTLSW